jgi:hypothetical protein
VNQSGLKETRKRVTKAGDPLLREMMFLAADKARLVDPQLAAKYLRPVSGDRHRDSAICHLATDLLTRIAACMRTGQPYVIRDIDSSVLTPAEGKAIVKTRYKVDPKRRDNAAHRRLRERRKQATDRESQKSQSAPTSQARHHQHKSDTSGLKILRNSTPIRGNSSPQIGLGYCCPNGCSRTMGGMETVAAPALDTATWVLEAAREQRGIADRAESRILALACDWADQHPALLGAEDAFDDEHLPGVAWDATAEFALAVGLSHDAGQRLIHQALELRHRLPRLWARAMQAGTPVSTGSTGSTGGLQSWRARRIADLTINQPDDVVAVVDATLAPLAHKVGPVTVNRLLDETLMRLDPEEHEIDRVMALETRHVTVRPQVAPIGLGYLEADADLKDLLEFSDTLTAIAGVLADQGSGESLDVRRSLALGVLADPHHAVELLDLPSVRPPVRPGRPRKQLVLYVHLSEEAITGTEPVGRCERPNTALLAEQIRDWCSRSDTHVRVQPVIDLNEHHRVEQYEIPDRLSTQVNLRDTHCVFPWCTRPARACDLDHIVPHGVGGATCDCNLAPLCRRHHRLKTHTRWTYTTIEPGTYLWTTPHGHTYLTDHTGTRNLTPSHPQKPRDHNGCQEPPDG